MGNSFDPVELDDVAINPDERYNHMRKKDYSNDPNDMVKMLNRNFVVCLEEDCVHLFCECGHQCFLRVNLVVNWCDVLFVKQVFAATSTAISTLEICRFKPISKFFACKLSFFFIF